MGSQTNRTVKGLLLEFDRTIAETERFGQRVAYKHAFSELGLDWHWDEAMYRELLSVAGGKERLRYYLERYRPQLLDDVIASGLIVKVHQAKIRHFARIAPTIPLRPGLLRLVAEAHAAVGLRAALAAHLTTIMTMSDYTQLDDFTEANAVLTNLGEPDEPAQLLRGVKPTEGIVDVTFLKTVLEAATA